MTRSHQTKVALWCSSKVSVVVDRILDFDMHVIWRPLGWTRRYSHELAVGICMRSINKNSVCGSTPISPTDARLCPLLTVFANTAQSEHPLSTNAFQKKSPWALWQSDIRPCPCLHILFSLQMLSCIEQCLVTKAVSKLSHCITPVMENCDLQTKEVTAACIRRSKLFPMLHMFLTGAPRPQTPGFSSWN